MPFTISHVAAVLPFARPLARWRLLSAAVIGAMVPDFGLFMPWRPARIETHGASGLLTFCLPVGLATFWIFQALIKPAVTEILPDAAYARWRGFALPADIRRLTDWALAACGVEAGAVTHLIWDAFTHEGARGIRMIPALDDPAFDIVGHHLVGARLLQDVSSLVGLGVVLAVIAYGLRPGLALDGGPRAVMPAERLVWVAIYAVTASGLTGLFLLLRGGHHGAGQSLALIVGNCAIAALRGCAAALALVSGALMLRLRAKPSVARAVGKPQP